MNVEEFKAMVKVCHHHEAKVVVSTQLLLDVIAELEGAQFAAASHLRTVEQQAKIIAGMQAAPIQSGDEIPVSMSTYGTKEACEAEHARRAALVQSGDVRNQALEEAAQACEIEYQGHSSLRLVSAGFAAKIRALASTPSAAMPTSIDEKMRDDIGPEDFGVPALHAQSARNYANWVVSRMPGRNDKLPPLPQPSHCLPAWSLESCPAKQVGSIPLFTDDQMHAYALSARPAAQPQAGGRELTDAKTVRLTMESGDIKQSVLLSRSALDQAASPGTMLHMHVDSMFSAIKRSSHITGTKGATE